MTQTVNHHFPTVILLAILAVLLLASCGKTPAPAPEDTPISIIPITPAAGEPTVAIPDVKIEDIDFTNAEVFGTAPVYSETGSFYKEAITLQIQSAAPNGVIYYTTNGHEPKPNDLTSVRYEGPLSLEPTEGDYPRAYLIKAKTYYTDGTVSPTAVHTFFISKNIFERYTESTSTERFYIVSIAGEPSDYTKGPSGILYGQNYEFRGDFSERAAHVEIVDTHGNLLIDQFAGARVYGAYSRRNAVKSLKLFARKSYDENAGKFKFDFFGTENALGEEIGSYDKLVLRSYGNDWQFGFLRDELNQRLAAEAGFPFTEAVVPAVVYLNGTFYNFVWMHESYCDAYFKQKVPSDTLKGEFVVIGGTETDKKTDTDSNDVNECAEFNAAYKEFIEMNFEDDEDYAKLTKFMDVESYLDFYAVNIYICNYDWPHNNYKCFRYYPDESGELGEGIYDGRWRFLPHDMDYCYNIYNNQECPVETNYLKTVMTKGNQRYSPLFTLLMDRDECREYFVKKILELADGAFSAESVYAMIDQMTSEQGDEIGYYIEAMKRTYNKNNNGWGNDIWTSVGYSQGSLDNIRTFATSRKSYILSHIESELMSAEEIEELLSR